MGPDCITKKFREFLGGNSSSYLGYLSDKCMIRDWGSTSSGSFVHGLSYSGARCVLKSPCSFAMTRGCFVVMYTTLYVMATVRSSPCGPHHENFERNLFHVFVSTLFGILVIVSKWLLNQLMCHLNFGMHSFKFFSVRMLIGMTLCCTYLSVDSALSKLVNGGTNGCHLLQDGSRNASESEPWRRGRTPALPTSTSGGMAIYDGGHQCQYSDVASAYASVSSEPRQSREPRR